MQTVKPPEGAEERMKMSSVPYQKKKLEMMEIKEVITRLNRMTVRNLRYAVVAHNRSELCEFHKNQFDAEEEELRKDAAALNTAARLLAIRRE